MVLALANAAPMLIITRPAQQAHAAVQELAALGCPALALPLISISGAANPDAVAQTWRRLPGCDVVMFVSSNAVNGFFAARPVRTHWPAGLWAASTGPGTTATLLAQGLRSETIIEPAADTATWDSEALWVQLQTRWAKWAQRRVLIVRGDQGRDWLADTLRQQGAQVDLISSYRTAPPVPDAASTACLHTALAQPARHWWHFSSSLALKHLQDWLPQADWRNSRALATHPRIAEKARALGFGSVLAVDPGMPAAAALVKSGLAQAMQARAQAGPDLQSRP